ncbi:MAG: GGDEF domain-containing protein [Ideonella sp.]|nr:GGDEF domain-containing protein [Ideonella sp.]
MPNSSRVALALLGGSDRLQRQVRYWAITLLIYAVCVLLLVAEVALGAAPEIPVRWLVGAIVAGTLLFYVPVRASERLGIAPAPLAVAQALFAIGCIVASYALIGPARGSTLALLTVVLVFCAFALSPRQAHLMSLFTVLLLGAAMVLMNRIDPLRYEAGQEWVHFALAASMLAAVSFLTGQLSYLRHKLKAQKTELADALARIQEMATRDDLTLLANRRHMGELLAYELPRHARKGHTLCLALIDIDHFKRINDSHGHAAGDEALREFAKAALGAVRTTDVLARWGGEEFLLLLPDTEIGAATQVLARIQARIAALRVDVGTATLELAFSAGLAASRPGESAAAVIERADRAMYAAKAAGRNRVLCEC